MEVIQCKYWSSEKTIHEKHVFQLYGTKVAYEIDQPYTQASYWSQEDFDGVGRVTPRLFTSTILSDRAKQFARALEVKYTENFRLQRYPCKCNVSLRDGSKIYHLPFDQQYDRTVILPEKLECWVDTVEEAEALGFRRAFRWKGLDT
ncbi:MAG: hypothetical protein HY675_28680 [Chloroflexi bacterium]|nr:hypothetical protein [Chloroflexota bacterium]